MGGSCFKTRVPGMGLQDLAIRRQHAPFVHAGGLDDGRNVDERERVGQRVEDTNSVLGGWHCSEIEASDPEGYEDWVLNRLGGKGLQGKE